MTKVGEHAGAGAGLLLAVAMLAVLWWVVLVGPSANDVTIGRESGDRYVVASVAVGGPAWWAGVRQGMEVLGVEPAGAADPSAADPSADWVSLLVTDGVVRG